jgi:SAM-dependent methyltransferase
LSAAITGDTDRLARLEEPVVAHYEDCLRRHGPSARGVDWKDEASQRLRFDVLTAVAELDGRSVYDVGAGVGHLYDHLIERGVRCDYAGTDLSAAMVDCARRRNPGARFERRDILGDPPARRYDYVLCSGLFHVKLDADPKDWLGFVLAMIRRMYEICSEGIAFNMMSDQVDFRDPRLFYVAPGEILDRCRRDLARHVVLRHDYPLYEWTAYVLRHARG